VAHLFEPLALLGVTLPSRIAVSPMCEYSCVDGMANDWHLVHLGSRAVGGAGLVLTEAAALSPEARISPDDLGIGSDAHVEPLARIARFVRSQGGFVGIQLAHAGRKASTPAPWKGRGRVEFADGGGNPSRRQPSRFPPEYHTPRAMTKVDIRGTIADFVAAVHRAPQSGFEVVELHAAHGHLAHQFLSPLSNQRDDEYGGSFANRVRFVLELVTAVRGVWPEHLPLFVRISATDWAEGGWTLNESVELAALLKQMGVDLIDCSSGGLVPYASIPVGPGYQVPFAERIRREAGIATGAVGMIAAPAQADQIVRNGQADLVLLARELLRDPYWPVHAAEALGLPAEWPPQYLRAAPRGSPERKLHGVFI
jgi:2,4-dienoyl-CoA reductase-like NADH-dependent reductase (Old Yellow Enzyme family)